MDAADLARERVGCQEEIDEACTGHLGLRHEGAGRQCRDNGQRQLAGVFSRALGEAHRYVRGEVAMRRVPGALDYYRCSFGRFRNERADELLKSSAEELFQLGFQGLANLEQRKRKGRKCTQKPNDRVGFGGPHAAS